MPTKTGITLDEKTCKRLRSALGDRTLTSLAAELGVSFVTVSCALNRKRTVSIDLIHRMAAAVGLIAEVEVVTRSRVTLRRNL